MSTPCGAYLPVCSLLRIALRDLRQSTNKLELLAGKLLVHLAAANGESPPEATIKTDKLKPQAKQKTPQWQLKVVENLSAEVRQNSFKYWAHAHRKAAIGELIRYAVNEDYSSLVAFAMQFLGTQEGRTTQYFGDDEFFAVVLLLAARGLQKFSTAASVDDAASASLFYSTATFLERLTIKDDRTRSAALVLLDRMEKWSDLRSVDERSSEIDRTYSELQKRLTKEIGYWRPKRNRLFLNDVNQEIVSLRAKEMFGSSSSASSKKDDFKYPTSLKLVANLNAPASTSEYLGSPFFCETMTEKDYVEKFSQQQLSEASHSLRVRNLCRTSKKITAEELVHQWGWKSSIEVKGYMSTLDMSECASLMLSAVLAACAAGQNLLVHSQFMYQLSAPIFNSLYDRFIDKIGIEKDKIAEEVFKRYVQYFVDSEISRQYTLREWWMDCCLEAHVDPGFSAPFADMTFDMRAELGSFLLSVVVEACKFPKEEWIAAGKEGGHTITSAFSIRDVPIEEESMLTEDNRVDLVKMVQINSALMDLFGQHQFEWLIFPSDNLPMRVPPRPWIDLGNGGPSYTRSSEVLRSLEEYERFQVSDEVKTRYRARSQARPVFDALNDLGTTPWKINEEMLKILKRIFEMTGDVSREKLLLTLSIPLKAETVDVPDYVKTFGEGTKVDDIPKERWIQFSKAKYEAMKKRGELNSLWFWLMYRVALADFMKNDVLYFPHNMDFRGRVYPISPYLSHMGDDINRSLLLFAKGKPLGSDGLNWLKLHCVNLTGMKKRESIAARLQYAEELLPKMLDSANNPLNGQQWWLESDEPWQTLAACIEVRNALSCEDPATYISYFPIHQDGTCNGLQHYAALGRDGDGGKEVNLLPRDLPSDVYSGVAQRVELKRIEDEKSPVENVRSLALSLRAAMPQAVPRKVIKQTVMTTVYGVTMYGAVQQIKRQLKAALVGAEECAAFATYLAQKTFLSLNESFNSSMMIKDWFRNCAKTISRSLMKPVEWETPLGLPVVQPYLRLQKKYKKLCFLPVPVKQMNAFPPNFVHSLDSTHMMLTTLNCRHMGITFAAVHDCYWTHACTVDEMNRICRDQFINLHKEPLVEQCGKFFASKYLDGDIGRMMPSETISYLKDVFTPKFSFGNLDIEKVRESIYFFS